jgi:hypothetical protein
MLTLSMLLAPRTADAQLPKKVPRIGVLHTNASAPWFPPLLAAFRQGLRDFGYVEGQNLVIEYRSAEGHAERLPALAAELVQLQVEVIVVAEPTVMEGLTGRIIALAAQHRLPSMYYWKVNVEAGGLMSYGPSLPDWYRPGMYTNTCRKQISEKSVV